MRGKKKAPVELEHRGSTKEIFNVRLKKTNQSQSGLQKGINQEEKATQLDQIERTIKQLTSCNTK